MAAIQVMIQCIQGWRKQQEKKVEAVLECTEHGEEPLVHNPEIPPGSAVAPGTDLNVEETVREWIERAAKWWRGHWQWAKSWDSPSP